MTPHAHASRRRPPGRLALVMADLGGGGAERVMLRLAEGFVARGWATDIVVASRRGPLAVPSGVRLIETGGRLVRYLRRERPRALLSTLVPVNVACVLARFASGVRSRLVLRESTTITPYAALARQRGQRGRWLPAVVRACYRFADAVIAVSEGVAYDLRARVRLRRVPLSVIANPIVEPAPAPPPGPSAPPHPWLNDGGGPIVIGVGRLIEDKGFDGLVRAVVALRRGRPRLRLMLLGEGPEREPLTRLARAWGLGPQAFALPGFVPDVDAYLRHAAAFALTSSYEGLPGVVIEALAAGCPVVAADCPSGPREILVDGRYGRLVPPGDLGALTRALEATLRAPPDPALLKRRALAYAVGPAVARYLAVLVPLTRPRP